MMLNDNNKIFGQPRGLYVLVMTDLWGRFGYAGMKSILIYYLIQDLMFTQEPASIFFGEYTSVLMMMPLPCGVIADRCLGRRRSVLIGAGLMCIGNFMLIFPFLVYPALAILAFGSGLFQSCLPSQVMTLYRDDEAGAAIGFNFYYVGLNIGALLGGVSCGAIGEYYGWKWGFALASLGMLPAIISFILGEKHLPQNSILKKYKFNETSNHKNNFNVLLLLCFILGVILFSVTYEQMFNSVAFWIAHDVDRGLQSFKIPMTWFPAINPLVVVLIGPVIGVIWNRQANANNTLLLWNRVVIGAIIIAIAYAFLAFISFFVGGQKVIWVIPALFMMTMTIGEIFFLPASMSLFGSLAPSGASASFFGIWFLAISAGNFLAGILSSRWALIDHCQFFFLASTIAILSAIIFFNVRKFWPSTPTVILNRPS